MAPRFLLFVALSVLLAALVSDARPAKDPFLVRGKVYCDTCNFGFETPKSTSIPGATVRIECKDRKTNKPVYSREGKTNSEGMYEIHVDEDHMDEVCDAKVVNSPQLDCFKPSSGRDQARVILTDSNGISSKVRFANAMGFSKEGTVNGCSQLLKLYQETDD
ncbi:Anther-specific protein LAT52 [Linum grandiflorum]